MNNGIILAPVPELIRYLSILRRSFACIRKWGTTEDRDGMLFGGWLADALHNVPNMLLHYAPHAAWHSPTSISDWLERGFPAQMRHHFGAPEHLLAAYEGILSAENAAMGLGIEFPQDAPDVAPPNAMLRYLTLFYDALLEMRYMRNYGCKPAPWPVRLENWSREADEDGRFNADFAGLLEVIPAGLVRWDGFDEEKLLRTAREKEGAIPDKYRKYWRSRFIVTTAP